jgi:hypothetical protein
LRILLSIGPTETAHFETWQDKAGNALALTDADPMTGSTVPFNDLTTGQPESLPSNLIMPEPCPFLSRKFPKCSIIRRTATQGAAMERLKPSRRIGYSSAKRTSSSKHCAIWPKMQMTRSASSRPRVSCRSFLSVKFGRRSA